MQLATRGVGKQCFSNFLGQIEVFFLVVVEELASATGKILTGIQ